MPQWFPVGAGRRQDADELHHDADAYAIIGGPRRRERRVKMGIDKNAVGFGRLGAIRYADNDV